MRDSQSVTRVEAASTGTPALQTGQSLQTVATTYLAQLAQLLALVPGEAVGRAAAHILGTSTAGKRVYVMGNGGSSATASHFVCDLTKTARVAGMQPVRAFSLTDNVPLLTAWANDSAYEDVFAEQIATLVESGDVVIAISASGNSPNIVNGLRAAAAAGAFTIGFVGFDGGEAAKLVDLVIHIPSHDYGLVEDTHSALTHAITAAVRDSLQTEAGLARFTRDATALRSRELARV